MNYKYFQEMLKKIFLALFIAATLACNASPRITLDDKAGHLKPNTQQEVILKEVINLFENVSYKKVPFNDSLSSVVFDNYIKTIDEGKNYMLQSDIDDFEKYRNTLLPDLKKGDLSTMFYIFNIYQTRYLERMTYALDQVKTTFNFDSDEQYTYDRVNKSWYSSAEEANKNWKKRVKYDMLLLTVNEALKDSTDKNIETLSNRYQNLISQATKINSNDAYQIIMNSFTASIDPHTNYFNASFAQRFNEDMARTFEGIGAQLTIENEVVKIMKVIPGGPAFRDKSLQTNDRIVAVAQGDEEFVDVIGWRLDNTVAKIKGPKGTTVRLKVIQAGQELTATPKIVTLVRDKIVMEETSAKKEIKTIIGDDGKSLKVGIIKIPGFYIDFKAYNAKDPNYKSTTKDVKLILDTLKNENVDAVLVDLRTNGGGSLMEAIELTGLFIDEGPIVQVRDTRNRVNVNRDDSPGTSWDGPLGIMVDRFSASASEILAGAIQDYGRGIVIGTQTYGKGTVQSAIEMDRLISPTNRLLLKASTDKKDESVPVGAPEFGQINITLAKFYRINGSSTQHKGVVPDIVFPMMFPADKFGESSEPAALPWDQIESTSYDRVADLSSIIKELESKHNKRMKASEEYSYLLEDIEILKTREKETSVTLQKEKLKKEREEREEQNLVRINSRRKLEGLAPIKKGDPIPQSKNDFIEDESLKVMADLISINKNK